MNIGLKKKKMKRKIENKILVIPDIHDRIDIALKIYTDNYDKVSQIFFLGDFFDSWHGDVSDAINTANFVKSIIDDPKVKICLSNHDAAYRYWYNSFLECQGYTEQKSKAINSILTKEDWQKFKLAHFHEEIIFSHAGVSKWLFERPFERKEKITQKEIEDKFNFAYEIAENGLTCDVWGIVKSGFSGLFISAPGPTWVRWGELPILNGFSQIVGHTPYNIPQIKYMPNKKESRYFNLNLDTISQYYAIISDYKVEIFNLKNRKTEEIPRNIKLLK